MSKISFGTCPLCPKGSAQKRLYGTGVCQYHLSHPEDDQSKEKAIKEAKKLIVTEQELNAWFRTQIQQRPERCENGCNRKLVATEDWRLKAMVCHIVPKRIFESVMVHPLNRWFGCHDCHTLYDRSWHDAIQMPVWPLCVERFQQFMHLLKIGELKSLPEPLRQLVDAQPTA